MTHTELEMRLVLLRARKRDTLYPQAEGKDSQKEKRAEPGRLFPATSGDSILGI